MTPTIVAQVYADLQYVWLLPMPTYPFEAVHRPLVSRRDTLRYLVGGLGVSVLAACKAPAAASPTPNNPLIKPQTQAGVPLTAVVASSELAVGRNRFAMGLIDAQRQAIGTGTAHVEFFKVNTQNNTAEKRSETDATFRAVDVVSKGIWVAGANFNETGTWGARVTLQQPGAQPLASQIAFTVLDKFSAPGYDDPAPRSASPTLADVAGDATHLCSNSPPCEMHSLSIADALKDGQKPAVVVFATPAFCSSATCAPELAAIQGLKSSAEFADRANFVHVEIYRYPFADLKTAPAVDEWKLPSDPWVFVVDKGGIVRDRFEGAAPVDELTPSLRALL